MRKHLPGRTDVLGWQPGAEGETHLNWLTTIFMAFSTLVLLQRSSAVGRTRGARTKLTQSCI
jgi:hypothetical protein